MVKGIYDAAAGMMARMKQLEAVSNNLANVNTTGFKRDRRLFRQLIDGAGLRNPSSAPTVKPQDDLSLHTDFSAGSLTETGNPLDTAIAGRGFFAVETPQGVGYTRNGSFRLDENLELVDSHGYRVLGENGPITVQGDRVVISDSGEIAVDGRSVDKLQVVDFPEPYDLRRNGSGLFVPQQGKNPVEAVDYTVQQGRLENSNVDPVSEMITMIELSRNYESLERAVHAQDDTLKQAVNDVAR